MHATATCQKTTPALTETDIARLADALTGSGLCRAVWTTSHVERYGDSGRWGIWAAVNDGLCGDLGGAVGESAIQPCDGWEDVLQAAKAAAGARYADAIDAADAWEVYDTAAGTAHLVIDLSEIDVTGSGARNGQRPEKSSRR